ncbi:hypothetical protein TNCV_947641 [Trichonephila clavipes]|nr:hypothetical protein TNCV_947641 [Trichonephila clavipes]
MHIHTAASPKLGWDNWTRSVSFGDIPELPVSPRYCFVELCEDGSHGAERRLAEDGEKKEEKFRLSRGVKYFPLIELEKNFVEKLACFCALLFRFSPFKEWRGRCRVLVVEMCPHVNTFACPWMSFFI